MRIKKTSETTPTTAQVVNVESNSTTDTYSCDKINDKVKEVYSTTEQVVGTWIDGKPLYRKVINMGTLPSQNQTKNVAHNINNLEFIIKLEGVAKNPTSGFYQKLPIVTDVVSNNTSQIVQFYANNTNISYYASVDRSAYTESYAIIEYTKTTDTGNS